MQLILALTLSLLEQSEGHPASRRMQGRRSTGKLCKRIQFPFQPHTAVRRSINATCRPHFLFISDWCVDAWTRIETRRAERDRTWRRGMGINSAFAKPGSLPRISKMNYNCSLLSLVSLPRCNDNCGSLEPIQYQFFCNASQLRTL